MTALAPIAIFTFKRPDTLTKVLKSLEGCRELPDTPITFFCDAPRSHVVGEREGTAQVQSLVSNWGKRYGARIEVASQNKGLRTAIITGVDQMVKEYGRVIVLEDDIIVSPAFLTYMNNGLNTFTSNTTVYQICAYMPPHRKKLPPCGFVSVGTCWGWGTWQRAWEDYNDDALKLLKSMTPELQTAFDFGGACQNYADLVANAEQRLNTWAVRWDASIFLKGGLSLIPRISLSKNIGFGTDGTNCHANRVGRILSRQRLSKICPEIKSNNKSIAISQDFQQAIADFHIWQSAIWSGNNTMSRIKRKLASAASFLLRKLPRKHP